MEEGTKMSDNSNNNKTSSQTANTSFSGKFCFLLSTIIIILLLLLLFWQSELTSKRKVEEKSLNEPMCLSRECIRIASNILERLDPSADPCDDMYAFSCGNFLQTNEVPEDYYARNLLQEMQEGVFVEMKHYLEAPIEEVSPVNSHIVAIKRLYRSCMSTEEAAANSANFKSSLTKEGDQPSSVVAIGLEALYNLTVQLTGGEWPLLGHSEDENDDDKLSLEHQLALLYLYQVQPFFQLFVAPHRNTSTYALHIFPGSTVMEQLHFGLPQGAARHSDDLSLESDSLSDAHAELYKSFQREVIKSFLALRSKSQAEIEIKMILADEQLAEMFAFEMELLNITKDIALAESGANNCTSTNTTSEDLCSSSASSSSSTEAEAQLQLNPALFVNISTSQLATDFTLFRWPTFFRLALEEPANVSLSHVLIHSHEYLRSLIDLLTLKNNGGRYRRQTVVNYLCWSVVAKYMPYLGGTFRHLSSEFQAKASSVLATPTGSAESAPQSSAAESDASGGGGASANFKYYNSRWKQCVYIACESLKVPAISLYLGKHGQEGLARLAVRIRKLIEEMKSTFASIIDRQPWIRSSAVKRALKGRVGAITANIGVQEHLRNSSNVGRMYERLEVSEEGQLISNIFAIARHETVLEAKKLLSAEVAPGGEWLFQPLDANAFYDFTLNDIIIPIGIIRSPLINDHIPSYLELPFLGIVLGHEIAHSIDVNSRKHMSERGKGGNMTEAALLANNLLTFSGTYKRKAQCFSETFSRFSISEADSLNVNGNTTLEENICDFASFQTAYSLFRSLKKEEELLTLPGLSAYSPEAIFFIRYGQLWCEVASKEGHLKSLLDNHSPGRFRANGVLMNSHAFARAFNCSAAAKMNPAEKCDLWSAGH